MISEENVYEFAYEVAALRPPADPTLEQFLMNAHSMARQVARMSKWIQGSSHGVVMIGDDDHLSLVLAHALNCEVDVYEIDKRIVASIDRVARDHSLPVKVHSYDVRVGFPDISQYNFFYVNPPYSSKTRGMGIKVWLSRALEACVDNCEGILVMPRAGARKWTRVNYLEVQRSLSDNGCVIAEIGEDDHTYEGTNDPTLRSTYLHILRVDATLHAPVLNIDSSTRIYR